MLAISTRGGSHPKTSNSLPSRIRPSIRRIRRRTYGIRHIPGIPGIRDIRICHKR
jgi:hypothetical protein